MQSSFHPSHQFRDSTAESLNCGLIDAMANHLPPTVEETQISEQAQDVHHASSTTSHSQDPEPPEDPLRNAPTFVLEEKRIPEDGAAKDASNSAGPSPGFLEKIMQKLGLNSIILMNMFKSVFPCLRSLV